MEVEIETKLKEQSCSFFILNKEIFLISICFLFIIGCNHVSEDSIKNKLIANYSTEDLNFFYELSFNQKESDTIELKKWNRDILYYIEGDNIIDKKDNVTSDVISHINMLDLPIKMTETQNKKNAGLHIVYASPGQLDLKNGRDGVTHYYFTNGIIDSARIGISNNVSNKQKKVVLYHELFHALGFTSHISTDAGSLCFWANDETRNFRDIEKKALEILYNYDWPKNYTSSDFESDFSNVLYHINGKKKFLNYVQKNEVDTSILRDIIAYGLIQPNSASLPAVYKHANNLKISYSGDVNDKYADKALQQIAKSINTITENFQLGFSGRIKNDDGIGVRLSFVKDSGLASSIIIPHSHHLIRQQAKFETIYRTDITIRHNIDFKKNYMKSTNMLANLIYQSIALKSKKQYVESFESNGEKINLKPEYRKILKVYYSHTLPNGFTKEDLEWVLEKLEN